MSARCVANILATASNALYMYEPGDIINLTRIEFNPSQWENMENKEYVGYIEVITIDQNIKEEEEYFDI